MKLTKTASKPVADMLILSSIAVTLLSVNPAWANENQQQATQEFSIPAQPLNEAINSFIETTDWQVGYVTAQTKGVQSKTVQGEYTKEQALKKLLEGTGIEYQVIEDNSITLQKRTARGMTTEMLLAQAPKENYPATVIDAAVYDGPVEQEDLTVSGRELSGYSVINANTATKTDTPILETPASIQVVPKSVMEDQQAIQLEDALKNVSGVTTGFGFGGTEDTFVIRGFENSTASWNLTEVYRDGALVVEGLFALADVERVEVLKGPAAMLFGRLQPGGLINVVTKRPQQEASYSVQQQFGSFDTYRTTVGASGSITEGGALSYRVDFEYLDTNSFRDFSSNEHVFVSPKLSWRIGERTQVDLEYTYFDQNTIVDWGIPVIGNRPANVPDDRFLGEPTDSWSNTFHGGGITLTHSFTDNWKFQGKFFKYYEMYDGPVNSPSSLNETTGELDRIWYDAPHKFDSIFGMANLTGKFSTGVIDHTLLIGADYFDSGFTEDGVFLGVGDLGAPASINIYNPIYGNGRSDSSGLANNSFAEIEDSWYGIYVQDQMTYADRWHLLLGFRYDDATSSQSFSADRSGRSKSSDQAFSPRVGLLYQPLPWLSLYGSFTEGFNHANIGRTVDDSSLDSESSRQYEAGIKGEWWDGRLTSSLVYYHLTKSNIKTAHSDPALAVQGFVDQAGEARSQGVEFDLSGQLSDDWSLIATYAYNDAEITSDRDSSGGTGNQGNRLKNTPRHSGSAWVRHQFNSIELPGLTAGLGVFVIGQREGDLENSFQLPGYARVDAALKYRHKIGPSNLTVQFNIQNLFDKEYFVAARSRLGVTPGEPITFLGSVKLEF